MRLLQKPNMKPQKQQVITVFKHGPKPRKMCRVLVAGHTSLDQVKMEITDGLGIATQENVILNTMGGGEVRSVYDILTDKNNIIIASFPGEFDKKVYSQRRTQPKGAYQRIPPPSLRLPAMSKSSTTRLPPISGGGWDNSSDGRSSGSDIMQRRVGYERQMKREYNARHSNRMNKLTDESAMEVSDILYSHDRQRRADHQIRLERRQKLALKHLQDQEQRLHQAYKPAEKLRSEKRFPKKLHDKVRVGRPQGSEYHQNVVNLFTTPRSKLPNSLNQHSVLPSVRKDKKQEKPSMIPTYSKTKSRQDQQPKRKREESSKVSQIPVRAPIPSINKPKAKLQPEIIREVDGGSNTPRSHLSVASSLHPASSVHTATPDLIESVYIRESAPPLAPPVEVIKGPFSTPAKRPSTPIAKPTTTSSSKVSVTSGIESLTEEAEDKPEDDTMQRVHTPQANEDLGYDSPKPTSKHPKLSSYEADDDIRPAKLTQRDSGLADSIEPDSTESRRQSVTPDIRATSPEPVAEQEREPSVVNKLDPVTEETEIESPLAVEEFKFKPMLEIFKPKSENLFNNTFFLGQTLGDGNFAIVKTAINKATKNGVAIKIIDKEKLKGKEGMMINEIRIMRKLDHDHCVKLYDIYESEPHIYLVTELVKDGDLFDCIVKNRCFAEHVVRGMMLDMVSALEYMHSRSIVHRDIKPENILVNRISERFRLKLGDFGLSMVVKEPIFTICGTPTYIAPEILVECGYGLEIDMWAVGVINYILLCGFPPFRSKNKDQEELFSLIMAGEFRFISPYWDKISHGAKDLISKLLQVVPDDRISAKQVLNHRWLKLSEE
ncbi:myosin light chain kinase 2, skeletal/cardiac muscle-like isoform X3 [Bolinopsis microptera]|uniref:myosin light chain kinase 2, skeletal/cardiac muscle-like isoform X3 n=1 Tax=Bolinopsis microptera TaxID=2820187 RepID=UPI00307A3FF4